MISRRTALVGGLSAVGLVAVGCSRSEDKPTSPTELASLEQDFGGRVGVYALDTGSGATLGHRANERFLMCSTVKTFIVSAILHRRLSEPGLLDKRIQYTQSDLLEWAPVTSQHVAEGMTVSELCDATLRYSDNTGANLLIAQLGGPKQTEKFVRSLGDNVSWEEFQQYWARVCDDELEINRATMDIFHIQIPKPKYVLLPDFLWQQMWAPARAFQNWVAAGVFSSSVREKAGMRWTPGDEVLLRVFGKAVQLAFSPLPDDIRLHPRAVSAYKRARGRLPADAPLVEAPKITAPPRDRRGLPMHYVPPSTEARSLSSRAGKLLHSAFSLASPPWALRGRREVA